ncbi:MAG: electron transfer flavoprotein subunit beta/FixA family protein [Deltaproteobacteria bacterium]|nr:electron transfer flavoprotein subunit beta/FixA family protein [Deltaproteobacteria bacterium]
MERIIVCVKPVPDPKHWDKVSMDPETQTLKREGIPSIINPLDKHALEAALTLREVHGGEVILLSMAPPFADATLRDAGSDTLATARILAAGCRWIGSFDLVLCGNLTVDGSTAQVCSQLGEFLDLPSVMHVVELSDEGGSKLLATQKIENGLCTLRVPLPAVLSVRKELNKPRYIPFTGILAAESKEIALLSNADLKINEGLVGLHGSPTQMAFKGRGSVWKVRWMRSSRPSWNGSTNWASCPEARAFAPHRGGGHGSGPGVL